MPRPDRQRSIAYLIHRIAVRIEDSINAKARKYRLRVGEIRVLMRILDHGDLTVGEVAEMTSIESSALSHLLRRLDVEGWIRRTRSSKDSRQVLVSLTARGKKFASMLQPYIREYNQAAENGIGSEQLEALYSQLETIYANIVRLEVSLHDFPDFYYDVADNRRVGQRAQTLKKKKQRFGSEGTRSRIVAR
jgi:DNA-binding MarR family transcriptional regulator